MFCFIVFLLLVGAGFYFYQKLKAIEAEIRAERKDENVHCSVNQDTVVADSDNNVFEAESETDVVELEPTTETVSEPIEDEMTSTEVAIVAAVEKQSGMKQTALYPLFADISKKQLQQMIKDMNDKGLLRREKKGSSYLLYIV